MFKSVSRACAALIFFFLVTPVSAALVVDQDHMLYNSEINRLQSTQVIQSFRQAADNIAGIRARFGNSSGTAITTDVTVTLFDGLPASTPAALASATVTGVSLGFGGEIELDFLWAVIGITPETEYFLEFTGTYPDISIMGINAGNSYSRGDYYHGDTLLGKLPDAAFQTYADDTFGAAEVPEPGALGIAGIGLAGIVLMRRRKRG